MMQELGLGAVLEGADVTDQQGEAGLGQEGLNLRVLDPLGAGRLGGGEAAGEAVADAAVEAHPAGPGMADALAPAGGAEGVRGGGEGGGERGHGGRV